MVCKNCGKKLEKGSKVCSGCGEAVKSTEKNRTMKLVIVTVAAVLLLAALAWVIYYGVTGGFLPRENNLYYKDSYTVKDNKALANKDVVVATQGEHELTNGQLQVLYMMQLYDFLNTYYDNDFDVSVPLEDQIQDKATGTTWQQYFLDAALTAWQRYTVLIDEGKAAGYELPKEYTEMLDGMQESLLTAAKQSGFDDIDSMLQADMGVTSSFEAYQSYLEMYYYGNLYFASLGETFKVTDEEMEAYFAEHEEELKDSKITKDSGKLVDVRHILVLPEGATVENVTKETFSDEAWAAGEKKAQEILNEWLAGEKTEESFAELANKHSVDTGSNKNGGLYTYVTQGKMVKAFDEWCFSEDREAGDYDIVKTEYGYHIIYYSYGEEAWIRYSIAGVMGEKADERLAEIMESSQVVTDYTQICLSAGDLT